MFFFPYKADILLNRIPLLTILISILCLFIFGSQVSSDKKLLVNAETYCSKINNTNFYLSIEKITGGRSIESCAGVLAGIHSAQGNIELINRLAEAAEGFTRKGKEEGVNYIVSSLSDEYLKYSKSAPFSLTSELQYEPNSFDPVTMISSSFAHADIFHLLGNLVFFFAFAAAIEIVVGWIKYLLVTLFLSVGVSISYTMSELSNVDALPTLGLSGVVMGMIGLFAYLMPTVRIRCILFFVFIFRTVVIPAWILAGVFVGWDIYQINFGDSNTGVNLVAHISGAIIGFLFGVLFFKNEKKKAQESLSAIYN